MQSFVCSTIHQDGASSRTTFRVLKRLEQYSLIECTLHTGRTHQIRVHLEHLGFPILGDKIYGQPDDTFFGISSQWDYGFITFCSIIHVTLFTRIPFLLYIRTVFK